MTILNMPTISRTAPTTMSFSLVPNTMRSESPLNGAVQTAELPGARWVASFSWQNLAAADARILKTWLNSLRGMAGRFYLHDYTHPRPSGVCTTGVVYGANQSGASLNTTWILARNPIAIHCDSSGVLCDGTGISCDNGDFGYRNALVMGDYIGVNGELKVVTENADVDDMGNCTIKFQPPLRQPPPDGAPIITDAPKCVMILADDKQDKFVFEQGGNVQNIQIDCSEVF